MAWDPDPVESQTGFLCHHETSCGFKNGLSSITHVAASSARSSAMTGTSTKGKLGPVRTSKHTSGPALERPASYHGLSRVLREPPEIARVGADVVTAL